MLYTIIAFLLSICVANASIIEGYVKLTMSEDKVLDAHQSGKGTPSWLWTLVQPNFHGNQVWQYDSQRFELRNIAHNRCLDSPDRRNGGEVYIWDCRSDCRAHTLKNCNKNQMWYFDELGRLHLKDTDFCLDNSKDPTTNMVDANNLQIYTCLSSPSTNYYGPNQLWHFHMFYTYTTTYY